MTEPTTTIQPQVTWYREYQLEPNANVTMELSDAEAKQAFENSLFKKIWGATLRDNQSYPASAGEASTPDGAWYSFRYGINAAGEGCEKSMLFGITLKHAKKEPATEGGEYGEYAITTGYLFIVAAYTGEEETDTKVRVRSHQLVVIPNTEFVDEKGADGIKQLSGIKITGGEILIGVCVNNPETGTGSTDFYFPLKSFFLEGRHQDPVPFIEGYTGKFAITLLSD